MWTRRSKGVDGDDAPKKRRVRRKSPSKRSKGDDDDEDEDEDENDENQPLTKSKVRKKKSKADEDEDEGSDLDDGEENEKSEKSSLLKKLNFSNKKSKSSKKGKDKDKDDEDEDDPKSKPSSKLKKKKRRNRPGDDKNDEGDDDQDDDAGSSPTPSSFRERAMSMTASLSAPSFKLPRPQFYKTFLKEKTLYLSLGLRHLQSFSPDPKPPTKTYAGSKPDDVISILIASMENLVDDPVVVHPLVRVHVVDITTGRYMQRVKRKGQKQDPATTQHEKQTVLPTAQSKKRQPNKKCSFIPPTCTRPFRLAGIRGANPQWDEQISILESYPTILSEKALLLFEVLDFGPTVPLSDARVGEGYYRIAWGFLKPRGANGQIRVGVRELPKNAKPDTNKEYSDYSHELAPSQKICRLQLYKYQKDSQLIKSQAHYRGLPAFVPPPATAEVPRVFLQYLRQKRIPYPSSITMIIGPVSKPRPQIVLHRPVNPWEQEKHRMKFQQLATEAATDSGGLAMGGVVMDADKAEVVRRGVMLRSRKPTETCLLPNRLLHRLHSGSKGALTIKFNNSGTLLAVGCCDGNHSFPVRIYDSESGSLRHEFLGHHSIVYDLQWSMNDNYLVSASADGTSLVFCLGGLGRKRKSEEAEEEEEGEENDDGDEESTSTKSTKSKAASTASDTTALRGRPFLVATLQHNPPVYLYSACFQPPAAGSKHGDDKSVPLVLTGSFDAAIRLWDPSTGSNLGLLGARRYHDSHVNAMVFDHKTGRLYSGDGEGCLIIWRKQGQGKVNGGGDYVVMRKINKLRELAGRAITRLALNPARPTGRGHIRISAHENTIRVFDLSTQRLTEASYAGADNHNSLVRATYSACGKWIIAGTDQGTIIVWDAKSGMRTSCDLDSVCYAEPVNTVAWHPTQHVVACSSYGGSYPVLLYSADRDPTKSAQQISTGDVGVSVGEGNNDDGGEGMGASERKEILEEKRNANRQRYQELKEKALLRRSGEMD